MSRCRKSGIRRCACSRRRSSTPCGRWCTWPRESPDARTTEQIAPRRRGCRRRTWRRSSRGWCRAGVVRSQRGVGGGITLVKPPAELTILEVVNAVDPIRGSRLPAGAGGPRGEALPAAPAAGRRPGDGRGGVPRDDAGRGAGRADDQRPAVRLPGGAAVGNEEKALTTEAQRTQRRERPSRTDFILFSVFLFSVSSVPLWLICFFMTHYVSHLEGAIDGTVLPFGTLANMHNGRPIWVRYDLDRIRAAVTPADIAKRPPSLWRYRELLPLPLDVEPVTLGEGMTPLLPCPRLGQATRAVATAASRTSRSCRPAASRAAGMTARRQHGEVARREAGGAADGRATPAAPRRPTPPGRGWSASSSCRPTRRS